jgi:DNA-binding HxlR family transcriptional regulator
VSVPAPDVRKIVQGVQRFGSPWKLTVLAYLGDKPLRFNEILRFGEGDGLNARTLSRVLKMLAAQGLVIREVMGTLPVAVQYSLTETGRRMGPLLAQFQELESDSLLGGVHL